MIWKNNSMKKYKVKRKTKIQINALVTRFNCYEDRLLNSAEMCPLERR